jgi:hypothetical protein
MEVASMRKKKQVMLSLRESDVEILRRRSLELDTSMSEIVRKLIEGLGSEPEAEVVTVTAGKASGE